MPARLHALPLLAMLACRPQDAADSGDSSPPADSGPDDVPVSVSAANGFAFTADLAIPSFPADPAADVAISWAGLADDVVGFGASPVTQAQLTGFRDQDSNAVREGLLAGTLTSSSIWIQFSCLPEDATCYFSDFQVFGHDFPVSDYFGTAEGSWLVTLWGADSTGVQGLFFLDPGADDSVEYGVPAASLQLGSVVPAVTPLVVPMGSDAEIEWSNLTVDPRGQPVDTRRLNAAVLLHLDTPPDDAPAALEAGALETAEAFRIDVSDRTTLTLSELGRPDGIDDNGTWLLALFVSSSWAPVPAFLGVLSPG